MRDYSRLALSDCIVDDIKHNVKPAFPRFRVMDIWDLLASTSRARRCYKCTRKFNLPVISVVIKLDRSSQMHLVVPLQSAVKYNISPRSIFLINNATIISQIIIAKLI